MESNQQITSTSHFIKMHGKTFTCQCGCNVFHYWPNPPDGVEWHVCNGCDLTYESEAACLS